MGSSTYGNNNGIHIGPAIISENIDITRVSRGSGLIGTQTTSNPDGTLQFFLLDPNSGTGADVNLTYGSKNTMRGFSRVNFGDANGIRAFVSGFLSVCTVNSAVNSLGPIDVYFQQVLTGKLPFVLRLNEWLYIAPAVLKAACQDCPTNQPYQFSSCNVRFWARQLMPRLAAIGRKAVIPPDVQWPVCLQWATSAQTTQQFQSACPVLALMRHWPASS